MFDIRTARLEPRTFGEWIDALIVRNLRMWHLQERVYELESLERAGREELVGFLKEATWMNLQRNEAMDAADLLLAQSVLGDRFELPETKGEPGDQEFQRVWEPC